jgi:PHP family Zn ribbon phosphoesterase
VNEKGEVEGFNERLLIGATGIPLDEVVRHIHDLGGIAVASHIDRESFSVISQLGFVAKESGFDALEVSRALGIEKARRKYPELGDFPFIVSSDAHFLDDIGTATTTMYLAAATTDEIRMACEGREGRRLGG